MMRCWGVSAVVVAIGGLAGVALESGVAAAATAKRCAVVSVGGHKYNVSATSVACSFADQWVVTLAGKRFNAHVNNVSLSGGPKGYTCRAGTKSATVSMPDVATNVQVAGNCAKGLGSFGGGPYFNWVVQSKY